MRKSTLLMAVAALCMTFLVTACEDENAATGGTSRTDWPYPVAGVDKYTIELEGTDLSFELVAVRKGSFYMGTDDTVIARENERPGHLVTFEKDFLISATEVTQELFKHVMQISDPNRFKKGDNLPVDSVSYEEATEFCNRLTELTHRTFMLPTEAQWEYAARGGHLQGIEQTLFVGSNNLDEVGWYYGNTINGYGKRTTRPVAQKFPNALGLYDMSGNVWEWCRDSYSDYPDSDQKDPLVQSEEGPFVLRGGCYMNNANRCRMTIRSYAEADACMPNTGFRIYSPLQQ